MKKLSFENGHIVLRNLDDSIMNNFTYICSLTLEDNLSRLQKYIDASDDEEIILIGITHNDSALVSRLRKVILNLKTDLPNIRTYIFKNKLNDARTLMVKITKGNFTTNRFLIELILCIINLTQLSALFSSYDVQNRTGTIQEFIHHVVNESDGLSVYFRKYYLETFNSYFL